MKTVPTGFMRAQKDDAHSASSDEAKKSHAPAARDDQQCRLLDFDGEGYEHTHERTRLVRLAKWASAEIELCRARA